jgi:hypothetical protein
LAPQDRINDAEMALLIEQLRRPRLREGDKRSDKRRNCRWGAVLKRPPQNLSCVVEDIGLGGCRVRVTTTALSVGETITLDIPAQKMVLDGAIVWKHDGEIGIQFAYSEASYNKND